MSGPGGQALPGATVTVNDGNGQPVEDAVSGTDGHYKIYDLTPGEYTVVTSPFEPAVRQVDLGSGESATVDLHLNTRARDDVRQSSRFRPGERPGRRSPVPERPSPWSTPTGSRSPATPPITPRIHPSCRDRLATCPSGHPLTTIASLNAAA